MALQILDSLTYKGLEFLHHNQAIHSLLSWKLDGVDRTD